MTSSEIAVLYERDLRKLIEEISLFKNEQDLWKITGSVKNSSGNLALHVAGGLNFLIGTTLAHTGYVRNRDQEFAAQGVERSIIVRQLEDVIQVIDKVVGQLQPEELNAPFPRFFDKENATTSYVLMQLLLHLNYHLGQVNYLRRVLE